MSTRVWFHESGIRRWVNGLLSERLCWVAVLLLFLVLRLFSGYPQLELSGDACTYLTLGRNFPWHRLYNHQLYLIHPPMFGFLIGLLDLVLPLLSAGLVVVLFFAVANFFALRRLAILYGLNNAGIAAALVYLSINRVAIAFDSHVSRISILQFFTTASLVAFQDYLKGDGRRFPLKAMALSGLCLMTSDQALFVLPCLFLQAVASGAWRNRSAHLVCFFLLAGLIYSLWPMVRLAVYLSHDFYPAGISGTLERVSDFNLSALLQPNLLPLTVYHRSHYTVAEFTLTAVGLQNLMSIPAALAFFPARAAILLAGLAIVPPLVLGWTRKESSSRVLASMSALLYWPCVLGMPVWYGISVLMPLSVLVGKGADLLCRKNLASEKALCLAIACFSLCGAAIWVSGGPGSGQAETSHRYSALSPVGGSHFLFSRPPLTRGTAVVSELPHGVDLGFMAPVELVPELAYLHQSRWLALPFSIDDLEQKILQYRIKYIVLTDDEKLPCIGDGLDSVSGRITARHIMGHPERFALRGQYVDKQPAFYRQHTFFLYEVLDRNKGVRQWWQ